MISPMAEILRYPELLRIASERVERRGDKQYADKGMVDDFLAGSNLVMEEKLDGSLMAVGWKSGKPWVQGKNSVIREDDRRPQYRGAWQWAWENCDKLEQIEGYLVYGEWLKVQHHIPYVLPDYFMAFDVMDLETLGFMASEKEDWLAWRGLKYIHRIHQGKVNLDFIHFMTVGRKSLYSQENCEGCVIKDYKNQNFIKFVTREFIEGLDDHGHWMVKHSQRYNELRKPIINGEIIND